MGNLGSQIEEIKNSLYSLSRVVNDNKDSFRVHRDNIFNKNFSIVLSSLEDIRVFAERLDENIYKSVEMGKIIQQRIRNEDKDKITEEGQKIHKALGELDNANQADFKALYIFSKIFLDKFIKLIYIIFHWQGISSGSVTKFFHSLESYNGNNPVTAKFIEECLKRYKAVDVFLTSYRDDYVVHSESAKISGTWFMNEMNGVIRFLHPHRPSPTPNDLIYVVKNCVILTSEFIINNWSRIMEKTYKGVIIEESLENKEILKDIKILNTKIEPVTEKHKTPWLEQWTLHTVEIPEDSVEETAERISHALDSKHDWYADFKNNNIHFIIFKSRVFKIDRTKRDQYEEATRYGISLGIPDYQVDFSPHIKKWER